MKIFKLLVSATMAFAVDPAVQGSIRHTKEDKTGKKGKKQEQGGENKEDYKFTPAQPITYFRNRIDPNVFEWVDKNEVEAGNTTCGFLKADLGSLPRMNFPKVQVYICVQFAKAQPAPKGNMFVHCGGPGTTTGCLGVLNSWGIPDRLEGYNFISIDQRGLGRSLPSFAQEECTMPLKEDNSTIVSFSADVSDPDVIDELLQLWKQRVANCWTCENCGFKMNAEQEDGSIHDFHFLEYSGTRQLAEDMERFRKAIKADKISLYGLSYGTKVMATYATIFPESVALFSIDSNIPAGNDLLKFSTDAGVGMDLRIKYILYSCWARRSLGQDPNGCPVPDLGACLIDASNNGVDETLFVNLIYQAPDRAEELCEIAANGDTQSLDELLDALIDELTGGSGGSRRQVETSSDSNPYSQPSSEDFVVTIPNYSGIMGGNNQIPQWLIFAQDNHAGGSCSYDDESMVKKVLRFNEEYDGAGTKAPARQFLFWLVLGFYWPKGVPLPPLGNPFTKGIVSGQLFDSATPYEWTQQMRESFPSTTILTSQSLGHGLLAIGYRDGSACLEHVLQYFESGSIDFIDGQICWAPFALTGDLPFNRIHFSA